MRAEQILGLLPHRYPFLLIDRVIELTDDKVVALKNVTFNEPHFQGHFPGRPIMPGVLILEAMAQAAGVLVFSAEPPGDRDRSVYYYVGIDNARFKKPVTPGDALHLDVSLTRHLKGLWKFHGKARVGEAVAAEADLLCTIRHIQQDDGTAVQ